MESFGVHVDHAGQDRVVLRLDFAKSHAHEYEDYEYSCHCLPPYLVSAAALRHRSKAMLATSLLSLSIMPAVALFHTSVMV